jgi:hypothetical protein
MAVEEIQKFSVKVHLRTERELDGDPVIEIFGRWRTDPAEEIVDLADYAHIAEGPLVVLVGRRYNLALDTSGGRPGIQYSSKKGLSGGLADRLAQVIRLALTMARRLVSEPEFPAGARLAPGSLEVAMNDRLLAPNDDASHALVSPALAAALDRLYGTGRYEVRRDPDPTHRLSYTVTASGAVGDVEALIARLG